jgi:AraC-like DNA-binding protein
VPVNQAPALPLSEPYNPIQSKLEAINVLAVQHSFKHHYGKTILVYTLEKRIDQAKKLLLEEKLTLDYIAYEIGYANRSGLIKLFKKHVGCRPGEWRVAQFVR